MTAFILSEEDEQIAVVNYLELLMDSNKILAFTAFPQNGNNIPFIMRNKRLGVRPGFPDLILITRGHQLVFIEMKKKKGGTVRPEQRVWIELLIASGVVVHVCNGFDEAKLAIDRAI